MLHTFDLMKNKITFQQTLFHVTFMSQFRTIGEY